MKVGIVGLGLIGGSFAKAYSKEGHCVLAYDSDASVLSFARLSEAVSEELTAENIGECELLLLCLYPHDTMEYLRRMGEHIGHATIVIDCCGTKRGITESCMETARQYGFTFLGGHPMAGTQYSGFKYARAGLFRGAPMVIVPPDFNDIALLNRVKELLAPAGFARISVTTAAQHDETIAFTSQLAHVVSSAYIKSPTALAHKGFSAGSYKDMTRVAWLNPQMWAELFLDNRDNLLRELDIFTENLDAYKEAIKDNDREKLVALLAEGKARKEEVDG